MTTWRSHTGSSTWEFKFEFKYLKLIIEFCKIFSIIYLITIWKIIMLGYYIYFIDSTTLFKFFDYRHYKSRKSFLFCFSLEKPGSNFFGFQGKRIICVFQVFFSSKNFQERLKIRFLGRSTEKKVKKKKFPKSRYLAVEQRRLRLPANPRF